MADEDLNYPENSMFPPLYSIDKRGCQRVWKIWVVGNSVRRLQGLVEGKKTYYSRPQKGKNVGRSNETTDEEQAVAVAQSQWTKQLDKGYLPLCKKGLRMVKKIEAASAGGHNARARSALSSALSEGSKGKQPSTPSNSRVTKIKPQNLKLESDNFVISKIIPMKAQAWDVEDDNDPSTPLPRVIKHFDFDKGVTVQAKLDGWRCVARYIPNTIGENRKGAQLVVLTTNSGKQYPWFESLRLRLLRPLKKLAKLGLGLEGIDGELYCHDIVDEDGTQLSDSERFQTITKMCSLARTNPHPLEDQISLIAFDVVDPTGKIPQSKRAEILDSIYDDTVESHTIYDVNKLPKIHKRLVKRGYEGIILRAHDLTYTRAGRSGKMRKYKGFKDREYEIIGAKLKEGADDHYFVWVCHDTNSIDPKTRQPRQFKVPPMDLTEKERARMWKKRDRYIGCQLTVKYQELTKDRIPRFPKGVCIREDQ
jgi:hypothetical protein